MHTLISYTMIHDAMQMIASQNDCILGTYACVQKSESEIVRRAATKILVLLLLFAQI